MFDRQKIYILTVLGLVFLNACGGGTEKPATPAETAVPAPAAATKATYDATKGSSVISGTINLEGTAPTMVKIKMNSDPECMKLHPKPITFQEVVTGEGGTLQNVFVYVKEGLDNWSFNSPQEEMSIHQKGCMYSPHVMGLQVDQPLKIVNDDATLHNIHSYAEINKPFNLGQPIKGMSNTKTFKVPEVMVKMRCDVHKWMSAYIGVLEHPFYSVTDATGSFSIDNLPAGEYVIEAWHEKYGSQTQSVKVGDGETQSITFTFKAI